MNRTDLATRLAVAVMVAALCAGCSRIDVDLSSFPSSVRVGDPVTFDVSLMNRSTCPVGGVTALLVPFVPRNLLINQISDPAVRNALSDALDAFCNGGTFDIPGTGNCQIANGELICMGDNSTGNSTAGPAATATMLSTDTNGNITCETDGSHITCHIPLSMAGLGEQIGADSAGTSLSPLVCGTGPNGRIGACFTLKLDPAETKTGQLIMTPLDGGLTRNFILAFATRNQGVCKTGVKGVPCSVNADCAGMSNTCSPGMCSGGTNDGRGCDVVGDCPGTGTSCVACAVPDDGQILSNLACTSTSIVRPEEAPALSRGGIAAVIVLLLGVGCLALRRTPT